LLYAESSKFCEDVFATQQGCLIREINPDDLDGKAVAISRPKTTQSTPKDPDSDSRCVTQYAEHLKTTTNKRRGKSQDPRVKRTQDARRKTQDARRKTQDTRRKTQDARKPHDPRPKTQEPKTQDPRPTTQDPRPTNPRKRQG
jgi:hypothetical protein